MDGLSVAIILWNKIDFSFCAEVEGFADSVTYSYVLMINNTIATIMSNQFIFVRMFHHQMSLYIYIYIYTLYIIKNSL